MVQVVASGLINPLKMDAFFMLLIQFMERIEGSYVIMSLTDVWHDSVRRVFSLKFTELKKPHF